MCSGICALFNQSGCQGGLRPPQSLKQNKWFESRFRTPPKEATHSTKLIRGKTV